MLWYEDRFEKAALEHMRDYVLRGAGKGRTVMQGKSMTLGAPPKRIRRPKASKAPPVVTEPPTAATDIRGRKLKVGSKVQHSRWGRCEVVAITSDDEVRMRCPDGIERPFFIKLGM
jgi:hypothetical protein